MSVGNTANRLTIGHPSISITPLAGRTDEPVHIRVVGLSADQHITLYAEQYDDTGNRWQSYTGTSPGSGATQADCDDGFVSSDPR